MRKDLIGIGVVDIYIDVDSLSRDELEGYSRTLFYRWESYVSERLSLQDYSLSLVVEDGSIKALGKIGTVATVLYFGIAQYGSFIHGVHTIKSQISDVAEYLGRESVSPFENQQIKPKIRKKGEALSSLETIIKKVESGTLSADDALDEIESIFLGEVLPDSYEEIYCELKNIPEHPSRHQLDLDIFTDDIVGLSGNNIKIPKRPRPNKPHTDQFRVDVWRDSKDDKVKVVVSIK